MENRYQIKIKDRETGHEYELEYAHMHMSNSWEKWRGDIVTFEFYRDPPQESLSLVALAVESLKQVVARKKKDKKGCGGDCKCEQSS